MGRGGKRRGGKGKGRGKGRPREHPLQVYADNSEDEALGLDDDNDFVDGDAEAWQDEGGDEDVLKLGDEEERPKGKKGKKAKKKAAEEDEEAAEPEEEAEKDEEEAGAMTKGWRREDFYGGDDAGDASDADSDEELVLEEARRLEELRAKRLKGEADPLVALLGRSKSEKKEEAKEESTASAGPGDSGAGAQFESIFSAEVEKSSVQRDLKQLPEAKRRGLLKSEAPELVPLLTDFRAKLQRLREIAPLLSPQAQEHMKPLSVMYLKAKAALLLNTLSNLSYYIMLRAEGGNVRSHPVISQLVWLRELHEMVGPLDEQLGPAVAKATKDWKKLRKMERNAAEAREKSGEALLAGDAQQEAAPAPAKRLTLRERFRLANPVAPEKKAPEAPAVAAKKPEASQPEFSVSDLFRLPSKRSKGGGAADAPADLAESDPLVGSWQPESTLAEQLLSVRQQLGERAAKAKVPSADTNVEAQPLKPRQKMRESQAEVDAMAGRFGEKEDEEDESITKARAAKKAQKAAAAEARKQALAAQQFKPEEELDGRRATSAKILKNRGLVRQRKRSAGNARVNNRKKYEKAVKRRRGAVQEMREGAEDGTYDGEATGVRTRLKKSLRLS